MSNESNQYYVNVAPEERAKHFIESLLRWQGNRHTMAILRCACREKQRHRAWPLLAPFTDIDGNPSILRLYETVAAAFSFHPLHANQGNFGYTCAQLATFNPMLGHYFQCFMSIATRDEICDRLIPIVLAAKQRHIAIDYTDLFLDLWYWSETVKRRWAQKFWANPASLA